MNALESQMVRIFQIFRAFFLILILADHHVAFGLEIRESARIDSCDENSSLIPKYEDALTRAFPGYGFAKKRVCTQPSVKWVPGRMRTFMWLDEQVCACKMATGWNAPQGVENVHTLCAGKPESDDQGCISSPCQQHERCRETKTGYACVSSDTGASSTDETAELIRLTGGPSLREGRVEIFYQGVWRPVSGRYWDIYSASVVCRSLGFPNIVAINKEVQLNTQASEASPPLLMIHLECDGDENDISECQMFSANSFEQSTPSVGLVCGEDVCASSPCYYGGSCLSYPSNEFKCSCRAGFTGAYCNWATSCKVLYDAGYNETGIYKIKPGDSETFLVKCDMETDGGGWTVIQHNYKKHGFFHYQPGNIMEYAIGFGIPFMNHWIGLDRILDLGPFPVRLRMDMTLAKVYNSRDNLTVFASYDFFLANASQGYRGNFTSFIGTAGDAINASECPQSGQPFTLYNSRHGWWFAALEHDCTQYQYTLNGCSMGLLPCPGLLSRWISADGDEYYVTEAEMKIRTL